ncbi:Outer membrane lipoprotein-sorting protein [Gammaproteobacteria bacterium]
MNNSTFSHIVAKSVRLLLCVSMFLSYESIFAAPSTSPEEIARRNFDVTRFEDSHSILVFEMISKSGTVRRLAAVTWTKLQKNSVDNSRLVRFTEPSDIKGTATLTVEHLDGDDDIWINLPALGKVRRILANNKKDSFVGTDFSYGDIIGYRAEQWNHVVTGTATVDGIECWILESKPKSSVIADQSGLSKRVTWVRTDNYVSVKIEGYDSSGRILKRFVQKNIQLVDKVKERWQPMRVEAENVQTEHRTVAIISEFKTNLGLKDSLFSARSLDAEK